MSLVNMKELLREARMQNCAVGAFSVSSIDMITGVIRAAEALNTPVILQVAEVRLPYSPLHVIGPAMLAAARAARVPVAVHLDHGMTEGCIRAALDVGFTSVMFDGSRLPMEENIARTQAVIRLAERYGAAVEAEIICAAAEGVAVLPVTALTAEGSVWWLAEGRAWETAVTVPLQDEAWGWVSLPVGATVVDRPWELVHGQRVQEVVQ